MHWRDRNVLVGCCFGFIDSMTDQSFPVNGGGERDGWILVLWSDLIEWFKRMPCLLGTDHHQTNK